MLTQNEGETSRGTVMPLWQRNDCYLGRRGGTCSGGTCRGGEQLKSRGVLAEEECGITGSRGTERVPVACARGRGARQGRVLGGVSEFVKGGVRRSAFPKRARWPLRMELSVSTCVHHYRRLDA